MSVCLMGWLYTRPLLHQNHWLLCHLLILWAAPGDLHICTLSDYFSFLNEILTCDPLELQRVPEVGQNSMTMK